MTTNEKSLVRAEIERIFPDASPSEVNTHLYEYGEAILRQMKQDQNVPDSKELTGDPFDGLGAYAY